MTTLPGAPPSAAATGADEPARQHKSSSAFRTISEVADELAVAQHVLRFWESKFPQVRPLKRGGGRRYYRPEDVELLRQIRSLLYDEGYTIKGAQKLLRARRIRGTEERPVDAAPQPIAQARPARPVRSAVPGDLRRELLRVRDELLVLRDLVTSARDEV